MDYDPSVDIRRIDSKPRAIAEVSKYPIKVSNILDLPEDRAVKVIYTLKKAMTGRRLISFYGLFKEIKARLQLDDIEDGDLVHVEEDKPLNAVSLVWFKWQREIKQYIC